MINNPASAPSPPVEYYWKWRGKRWSHTTLAFGFIALAGSHILGYYTESYLWGAGFIVILLFAVGVFSFKTEREWSLKKRILWLCELPIIYYFLQFIPFGMITGLMRIPVGGDVISAMLLVILTLRRSTWFVEPGDPVLPVKEEIP